MNPSKFTLYSDTVYITVNTSNIQYFFFLHNLCSNKHDKTMFTSHILPLTWSSSSLFCHKAPPSSARFSLVIITVQSVSRCHYGFLKGRCSMLQQLHKKTFDCQRTVCHLKTSNSKIWTSLILCNITKHLTNKAFFLEICMVILNKNCMTCKVCNSFNVIRAIPVGWFIRTAQHGNINLNSGWDCQGWLQDWLILAKKVLTKNKKL